MMYRSYYSNESSSDRWSIVIAITIVNKETDDDGNNERIDRNSSVITYIFI